MRAPERVSTERLVMRRPRRDDAEAILNRYAGDEEVTHLLGWPRHVTLADTRTFLEFSESEWARWPAGPYLIESRGSGTLLGATGLSFETPYRAATGYVLARDAWGKGYATEALRAVVEVARGASVVRLYALCHPDNAASVRVLEKCGFALEGTLLRHSVFPNLSGDGPEDVLSYALVLR